MTDLLLKLSNAKIGLEFLAKLAGFVSPQAAVYLGESVLKISAAIQQLKLEERQVKGQ